MAERKLLVMMLGAPGSGKTYFAKGLANKLGAIRFNSDAMRLAIFGSLDNIKKIYNSKDRWQLNTFNFNALQYATERSLAAGQSVVFDVNTNIRAERDSLAEIAAIHGAKTIIVSVQTPQEIAIARGQEREATVEQRRLGAEEIREVILRHEAETDKPGEEELAISINGEQPFEEQYRSFQANLKEVVYG